MSLVGSRFANDKLLMLRAAPGSVLWAVDAEGSPRVSALGCHHLSFDLGPSWKDQEVVKEA